MTPTAPIRGIVQRAERNIDLFRQVLRFRQEIDQIVVHNKWIKRLPTFYTTRAFGTPTNVGNTCPRNLLILLSHNHTRQTPAELALARARVYDYEVARIDRDLPWRGALKINAMLRHLKNRTGLPDHILYLDSDDALLRRDPFDAVRLLSEYDCELLFSATKWDGQYEGRPDIKAWAEEVASQYSDRKVYLNSGVFVARTDYLIEILEEATEYITSDELTLKQQIDMRRAGELAGALPAFPKGYGSDQAILRYLQRRHHPRMMVDYHHRLAFRSPSLLR